MSDDKLIAVCADDECLSEEVERTRVEEWDEDKQEWYEEHPYLQGSYCHTCSGRDVGILMLTQHELDTARAENEDSDSC
jgi:hypothetical protein